MAFSNVAAEEPTPDPEQITVYFENNWLWTNVSCYYWLADGTDNTWPGTAMTVVGTLDDHDVYAVTIPANVAGIIFNGYKNDAPEVLDQTPDIKEGLVDGAGWRNVWDEKNCVESINFVPSTATFPPFCLISIIG